MKNLTLLLLLSACALNSTTDQVRPGEYVIRSVESDAGSSLNALAWETNHQGDMLCPGGFEQVAYRKERTATVTTHITTIKCK